MPPWIHSLLLWAASFDCSSVSVIVVAPAIVSPVGCPKPLSSGTLSAVTIVGLKAPVTLLSDPQTPFTARD